MYVLKKKKKNLIIHSFLIIENVSLDINFIRLPKQVQDGFDIII